MDSKLKTEIEKDIDFNSEEKVLAVHYELMLQIKDNNFITDYESALFGYIIACAFRTQSQYYAVFHKEPAPDDFLEIMEIIRERGNGIKSRIRSVVNR